MIAKYGSLNEALRHTFPGLEVDSKFKGSYSLCANINIAINSLIITKGTRRKSNGYWLAVPSLDEGEQTSQ